MPFLVEMLPQGALIGTLKEHFVGMGIGSPDFEDSSSAFVSGAIARGATAGVEGCFWCFDSEAMEPDAFCFLKCPLVPAVRTEKAKKALIDEY